METAILETHRAGSDLVVDRDAGIIRNVKVLGLKSENGRRYTEEAVKAARDLYEGAMVNIDHPQKDPDQPRSAYDRFGKLMNIRYVPGEGLYGDLEFLTKHPIAERIVEAAERMPDAFGLSHNAQGEGEDDKDGTFVVNKITEVRHVDLVADPATTRSLAEGIQRRRSKRRRIPEESKMSIHRKLHEAMDRVCEAYDGLKRHLGEDYGYEPALNEAEEPEGDDEKSMDYMDGEGEDPSEEKERDAEEGELTIKHGGEDEDEGDDEELEGDGVHVDVDSHKDDKKPMESRRRRRLAGRELVENRRRLRKIAESLGIKAPAQMLADLAYLPPAAAARTLNRLALTAKAKKPRSGYLAEGREGKSNGIPAAGDELFRWLQN